MKRPLGFVGAVLAIAVGIAGIFLGQADDAPGLVLLGLLVIAGTLAFTFIPDLRRGSRVIGLVLGAIALWALAVGIAGWIENIA